MTAIARLLDDFSRRRRPLRSLGASGQLGYGIPTPAFEAGLARAPGYDRRRYGLDRHRPSLPRERQDGADACRGQARPAQGAARGAATGYSFDRRFGGFGGCQAAPRADARNHSRHRPRGWACLPHGCGRLGHAAQGVKAGDCGRPRAADGYHAAIDRRRMSMPHPTSSVSSGSRRSGGRWRPTWMWSCSVAPATRAFSPASRRCWAFRRASRCIWPRSSSAHRCAACPVGATPSSAFSMMTGFELESMAPNRRGHAVECRRPQSLRTGRSLSRSASRPAAPICAM